MGSDGRPTGQSLKALYDYLSKNLGQGKEVAATYYPDADYARMVAKAEQRMNDKGRAAYSWYPWNKNQCFSFAREIIEAGRSR
jgi:hypothetical protein